MTAEIQRQCLACLDDLRGAFSICEAAGPCSLTVPHGHCMACYHTVAPGVRCCAMQYLRADAQLQEDFAVISGRGKIEAVND